MRQESSFYQWIAGGKRLHNKDVRMPPARRIDRLAHSHQLVGNFFHYRTAIKILGWDYEDVFEDGRLDLNPKKWADFGPLNFQLGPPKGVVPAVKRMTSVRPLSFYPPNLIPPLKKLIAQRVFKRPCGNDFEVIATEGAQSAIAYTVFAYLNRGDEAIITDPGYFFLEPPVIMAGGRVKRVSLSERSGFRLTPDDFARAITKRTRLLIICDPSNPFGTVQRKEELARIIRIAQKNDILIVNNITHGFHRLDGRVKHYPMCSPELGKAKNVVTVFGLSHGFGLAGVRIGFLGGTPAIVGAALSGKSALTRINTNLLMQYAALAALRDASYLRRCRDKLNKNLILLKNVVGGVTPFSLIIEPSYGYCCCVDTSSMRASCQELTVALLKRKCAVYPSDGLGNWNPISYLRFNFSSSRKEHFSWLKEALPEAIKEAESRKYKKAVISFFKAVGTRRAKTIIKLINNIERQLCRRRVGDG